MSVSRQTPSRHHAISSWQSIESKVRGEQCAHTNDRLCLSSSLSSKSKLTFGFDYSISTTSLRQPRVQPSPSAVYTNEKAVSETPTGTVDNGRAMKIREVVVEQKAWLTSNARNKKGNAYDFEQHNSNNQVEALLFHLKER